MYLFFSRGRSRSCVFVARTSFFVACALSLRTASMPDRGDHCQHLDFRPRLPCHFPLAAAAPSSLTTHLRTLPQNAMVPSPRTMHLRAAVSLFAHPQASFCVAQLCCPSPHSARICFLSWWSPPFSETVADKKMALVKSSLLVCPLFLACVHIVLLPGVEAIWKRQYPFYPVFGKH